LDPPYAKLIGFDVNEGILLNPLTPLARWKTSLLFVTWKAVS